MDSDGFWLILMHSFGFWWVLMDSDVFRFVLLIPMEFRCILRDFDGFWWILMDSDGFWLRYFEILRLIWGWFWGWNSLVRTFVSGFLLVFSLCCFLWCYLGIISFSGNCGTWWLMIEDDDDGRLRSNDGWWLMAVLGLVRVWYCLLIGILQFSLLSSILSLYLTIVESHLWLIVLLHFYHFWWVNFSFPRTHFSIWDWLREAVHNWWPAWWYGFYFKSESYVSPFDFIFINIFGVCSFQARRFLLWPPMNWSTTFESNVVIRVFIEVSTWHIMSYYVL